MQTLALPVYKSKAIAWLAMESLCMQVTYEKWELLVCEEKHEEQLGEDFFYSYFDRLSKAGCVDIQYIEPANWIPLSRKWKMMAERAKGENFFLVAADDYCSFDRIERTVEKIKDIYFTKKQYFYSIEMDKVLLFESDRMFPGNNIAVKTELMRQIPDANVKEGVDMWIRKNLHEIKEDLKEVFDNKIGAGVCTDGFNNIQKGRLKYYENPNSLWSFCDKPISKILPESIVKRLLELKKTMGVKIRKECLGSTHYVKSLNANVVVEDDPKKFIYYKSLGLPIFENVTHNKITSKRVDRNGKRKRKSRKS